MSGILAGIGWHMVGAASGAAFYAPIGKVKKWPWEITWAVAGLFSWIIMPWSVSFLLLPHFGAFYQSITGHVLLVVALLGAMWGVGNVSYGLTMRYLGLSLGIGVAMGVTLMVGTLIPPLLHGQAAALFTTRSGLLTMAGVVVALIGVGIVSYAGHQKELQLRNEAREFNLKLGIFLAVMCGLFSSGMSFAIDAARPMEAAALHELTSSWRSTVELSRPRALPVPSCLIDGGYWPENRPVPPITIRTDRESRTRRVRWPQSDLGNQRTRVVGSGLDSNLSRGVA